MSDNKSLRDIVNFTNTLETMLIESGGEITEEILPFLQVKEINLPEKIDNYDMMMERMNYISQLYKDKSDAYLKLAAAASKVVIRCEDNINLAMQEMGVKELKGHDVRFVLQNSPPSVEINNPDLIEESYKDTKTTVSINKKKISEDLKLGLPVAGAQLKTSQHLRKYMNTPGSKGVKK